mgnify:CR=1 FL=1
MASCFFRNRAKELWMESRRIKRFFNSERPVEAWGVIGMGIKAYDYMDGVSNHYGVYSVVLAVDGNEIFRSTVDRFSQEENRMINSWTYGQYMKSFIDPGNTLRLLKASNDNRGLVTIDEERDYQSYIR